MMVEKGIDIWRTSLINAYSGYLSSGLRAIEDLKKLQEEEIQSKSSNGHCSYASHVLLDIRDRDRDI